MSSTHLFVPEFEALAEVVQDELLAHVAVLEAYGPQLGRPRVDTLHGSRVSNMADARFAAHVSNVRPSHRIRKRP